MMTTVAVLGTGRMGRRHIEVVRTSGLQLSGVFDTRKSSLEAATEQSGVPAELVFDSLDVLYAASVPDCVIVATTAPSHADLVCDAIERGVKFALVEKPMASSLKQCDAMIETAKKHGAVLAVNHPFRFMKLFHTIFSMSSSSDFGGVSSCTIVGGNAGLAMAGLHYFDLFEFLTNEAIVEVSARFSELRLSNPRGREFEDRAGVIQGFSSSGRRLSIDLSSDHGVGLFALLAGPYATMQVDLLAGSIRLSQRDAGGNLQPTTLYETPFSTTDIAPTPMDMIEGSTGSLLALLNGQPGVTGETGRRYLANLVASHESADADGRWIDIRTTELPRGRGFPWA